jgi:UDP-N-acetylglucosamine acyltransferase
MARIHPTAIVEDGARLDDSVVVGPFCIIGSDVELGAGVQVIGHAVVTGRTKIGANTRIFPFASIGHEPQDLKYNGEASRLEIGSDNIIREHVTMNPGTEGGGMVTRVGSHCLFMVGVHIAHDCQVGDRVIMANNATLAGHVTIGDYAVLGGLSAVHQFVRIGQHSMVGGMSGVENDVIPYGSVMGDRARLGGLNIRGLQRRGFSRDELQALRSAYHLLFAERGTLVERVEEVAQLHNGSKPVREIVDFIRADSSRALCQPRSASSGG